MFIKKICPVILTIVIILSGIFVPDTVVLADKVEKKSDLQLMNEQFIPYNDGDLDSNSIEYGGCIYTVLFDSKGVKTRKDKIRYSTESDGISNMQTEEMSHSCYIEKRDSNGKTTVVVNYADSFDLAVVNGYIYFYTHKFTDGDTYNSCWDGVDYVRTDLNGKNMEVLYHDDYTPFGSAIGGAPSFLVTNDYLYVSKYNIERIDLSTKKSITIMHDTLNKLTGADWITLIYVKGDNYYFSASDNQQGDPLDELLPEICNGYFRYNTKTKKIKYIYEVAGYRKRLGDEMHNFIRKAGFPTKDYYGDIYGLDSDYDFAPRKTNPITPQGIYFNDYKNMVWFFDFSDNKFVEMKSGDHSSFKCGTKKYSGDNGYYYKDSYFDDDSTSFNQSLATMSLCMALSTYQNERKGIKDENVHDVMRNCGFFKYCSYGYSLPTEKNSIGCAISSKPLGDSTLVAVAVRSGGYDAEWGGNLTMGATGDHEGFNIACEKMVENIKDYIKVVGIKGKVKFWLSGYSRGAAVATQTVAKLNKTSISNIDFSKSSIYAYGFATPQGVDKNNTKLSENNNIFNIVDFNDIVPLVAPSQWGLTRCGFTYYLPNIIGVADADKYKKAEIKRLKSMGVIYELDDLMFIDHIDSSDLQLQFDKSETSSNPLCIGTKNREIILALRKTIGSRNEYVKKYESKLAEEGEKGLSLGGLIGKIPTVITEFATFHSNEAKTAVSSYRYLAMVHAEQSYYIAQMQCMDSNYKNNLKLSLLNGDLRKVTFNCPVDVDVYDSDKKLVASIKNEKIVDIKGSSIFSSIDENEQKIIYLPIDESYDVQVTARDDCKTSYSVCEYAMGSLEPTNIVYYSKVKMKKSEKIAASVPAFAKEKLNENANNYNGSGTSYTAELGNENLQPSFTATGDKATSSVFTVTTTADKSKGKVVGGGVFEYGEYCKVSVVPNDGCKFYGWYVDGKKVSTDETYRFSVEKDVEIVAQLNNPKVKYSLVGIMIFVLLILIELAIVLLIQKKEFKKI